MQKVENIRRKDSQKTSTDWLSNDQSVKSFNSFPQKHFSMSVSLKILSFDDVD